MAYLKIHFYFVVAIQHRELDVSYGWFCIGYGSWPFYPSLPYVGPGNVKGLVCLWWKRGQGQSLTLLAYLSKHASHPLPCTHGNFTVSFIYVLARSICIDLQETQTQTPNFLFLNCIYLSQASAKISIYYFSVIGLASLFCSQHFLLTDYHQLGGGGSGSCSLEWTFSEMLYWKCIECISISYRAATEDLHMGGVETMGQDGSGPWF